MIEATSARGSPCNCIISHLPSHAAPVTQVFFLKPFSRFIPETLFFAPALTSARQFFLLIFSHSDWRWNVNFLDHLPAKLATQKVLMTFIGLIYHYLIFVFFDYLLLFDCLCQQYKFQEEEITCLFYSWLHSQNLTTLGTQKQLESIFWMNKMNELINVKDAGRGSQLSMNE